MNDLEKQNLSNQKEFSSFSVIEKDGKKVLLVILQTEEKLEIEVSLHVRELHEVLSGNYEKNKETILDLIKWANKVRKLKQEKEEVAFQKRLELPGNENVKALFDRGGSEEADKTKGFNDSFERLCIRAKFKDPDEEPELYTNEDLDNLHNISKLLNIIDADKMGVFLPVAKELGIRIDTESEYGRKDIISKEWVKNNLAILEKLFKIFEKTAFSGQEQREYEFLTDDEKNILNREITTPIETDSEDHSSIDSDKEIIKYNNALVEIGLKDELERLFGEYSILNRWYDGFQSDHEDRELSPETSKVVNTTQKIYQKIQLLGLYYKNELSIKTKEGQVPFTGGEMAGRSIDGMLYYKQHQEKYGNGKRHRFIIDHGSGIERDVHRPIIDLKIDDLSYGALSDVFALLGESGLAPAFSIILQNSLLPRLKAHQENTGNSNQ